MTSSIKIIALFVCVGITLFMLYSYSHTKAELAKKEYENITILQSLQAQNQALKSLELETKSYQHQQAQGKEIIITKYQSSPLQDSSCQSQLEAIKKDIKLWYGISQKGEKP
ncbi:hypothetical protein LS68_008160 [Helicobacter sp. MIT 05-5293]|uniref:hypothetical protein n=1 Tax=Helicobacter sp. MIT 05-5293 TaxID=1548149 RepID=UPI00051CFFB1|nr:hypothetical protein [Helicobacter sp. MIT 05-5293]TLD80182.1 hypothetical protein LS68_008160 [Helicobacter sp. MIT 05-5293]